MAVVNFLLSGGEIDTEFGLSVQSNMQNARLTGGRLLFIPLLAGYIRLCYFEFSKHNVYQEYGDACPLAAKAALWMKGYGPMLHRQPASLIG